MIVYGWRGKQVAGFTKQDAACPACGKSPLQASGVIRYFHVFWIPLFPYRRIEVLECPACGAGRAGKDVPEPARSEIRRTVLGPRRLAPLFAGLLLLAAAGVAGAIGAAEQGRKEEAWLAAPAVNDHYVVKLTDVFQEADKAFPYGVLEVAAVQDGRVSVRLPAYAYDRASGASNAISSGAFRKADYWVEGTAEFELAELRDLRARSALTSVVR